MSDFNFFDDWEVPEPKAETPKLENYCREHDIYDCWFAHETKPAVVEVVEEVDPRDAELNEIERKVKELEAKVNNFSDNMISPLNECMSEIHKQKLNAKKIYDELVRELDNEYSEKWTELRKLNQQKRDLQFELDRAAREQQNLLKSMRTEKMLSEIESKLDMLIVDSPWGMNARKYQLHDLKFMLAAFESGKTGVLNANPTGMGKTFESIILDYCLQHMFPAKYGRSPLVLWVTIGSLIAQTVREIKKWNPERIVIPIEGSWPASMREMAVRMALDTKPVPAMIICNYEQLSTNKLLLDTEWDIIIADEVSRLKGGANPSKPTKVWLNFKQMLWECYHDRYGVPIFKDTYDPTPRAKFFVPLSGTPIQNKPGDMWAYLHLFKPTSFPKLKNFEREYAYGWPDVPINAEKIISIMKDQVVRQDKDKELDLPPKIYEPREVTLGDEQRKIYDQMKNNFFTWLDKNGDQSLQATVVIEWIIRLWELALYPGIIKLWDEDKKEIPVECQESAILDEAEELVENIVAEDGRAVVFSAWFNPPLYELKKRLTARGIKSAVYCGDQTLAERDAAVMSYNSDEKGSVQVLLCNMKAAGYGLNLQKARQAVFLDQWWNPAVQWQAEDRIHRPREDGTKPTIIIHKLQAMNTVYSFIAEKAAQKADMANSIMESKEFRKGSDWRDYLEGMI
jgi:SNF2 family DNA or RNA helicase